MKPNWHYYEAHINLAEAKNPEVLAQYLRLLGLKVVDLVNLKLEGITSEEFGTITTMHSDNLADLVKKLNMLL